MGDFQGHPFRGNQYTGGGRVQENYRGIKRVSFAPQGSYDESQKKYSGDDDSEAIQANKQVIDDVLDRVPREAIEGLNALYVTGGGGFIGSAAYYPPTDRRGYVSDEITLLDGWIAKSPEAKAEALAEEIGHRYHTVKPKLLREFVARVKPTLENLQSRFPEHAENYMRERSAADRRKVINGEIFAGSFAHAVMGTSSGIPAADAFWKDYLGTWTPARRVESELHDVRKGHY